MSKTLWKLGLILFILVVCLFEIIPPAEKLKPGIDLAGGTSLLYQINTDNLTDFEKKDIAQNMIRILQDRVDPGNQMNLVWRPHGFDRIEIQMPLASKESRDLRESYEAARTALAETNIDISAVREVLVHPEGMSREAYLEMRARRFEELAGGSSERAEALAKLGETSDVYQDIERQRNSAANKRDAIEKQLSEAKVPAGSLNGLYLSWDTLDEPNRLARMERMEIKDADKQQQVREYIAARKDLASAREALTTADGVTAKQEAAWDAVTANNINLDRLEKSLEKGGVTRTEAITSLNKQFEGKPERLKLITAMETAYDKYKKVSGRLDDSEDLKRLLRGSGVLEFRILPRQGDAGLSDADIRNYIEGLNERGPRRAGDDRYVWMKIRDPEEFKASPGEIVQEYAGDRYVLASSQAGEVLLHAKGDAEDWRLASVRPSYDDMGRPVVLFALSANAKSRFFDLTKNNVDRPMAILLDDAVVSAPNINEPIPGSGQISGSFTSQEVQDLVDKLRAGSLPARLGDQPISVNNVGPTMGRDNLRRGMQAGMWSLVVVGGFMLVYYLIAGAMANFALVMNILIIIAVMAISESTFTLPGIAGLILTIGMAVDANVLVNERIREEQARGSSLRMAIKNGYGRAFRTILDANVTTFITALILWALASEEVKGFAITLMIGLVANMFTALFVTRAIFDAMTTGIRFWKIEIKPVLHKSLKMLRLFTNPGVKWMSQFWVFGVISVTLVVGGWVIFIQRNYDRQNSPYSIEFIGGTSVHVVLTDESMTRDDVQKAIVEHAGDNLAIASSVVQKINAPDGKNEYEIITSETNRVEVTLKPGEGEPTTAEALTAVLREAADHYGDQRMAQVVVQAGDEPGRFLFETTQSNREQVATIVNKALPNSTATLVTRDTVNEAVREALAGKLDVQNDLQPRDVVVMPITDEVISQKPYLQAFHHGLLLRGSFGENQQETLGRLKDRFDRLRFKAEFEKYGRFNYNPAGVFAPGNATTEATGLLSGVELALMPEDFDYRIARNDENVKAEWDTFAANESERFKEGLSLATSLPRVTQIDPSVGRKSMNDALRAMVLSLAAIVIYIWIRFGMPRFSIAAIIALIHDVSITLGFVAASAWLSQTSIGKALLISDFKFDLPMVAAFLTLIGYSLNDTIVVFDRIRENRGKLGLLSKDLINRSINQTLSRTVLTSLTTLMVLVVMYRWGGASLRGFNYVMIVGIIVGTYSSIAVASPILLLSARLGEDRGAPKEAATDAIVQ